MPDEGLGGGMRRMRGHGQRGTPEKASGRGDKEDGSQILLPWVLRGDVECRSWRTQRRPGSQGSAVLGHVCFSISYTHTHTRTCVHAFHTCQTSTLSWVLSENLFSLWHQRKECDRVSRETRVLPPPRVLPHPDCLLAALSCPSSTEPDQWGRLRPPVPATLCCWGPFPLGKPRPLCAMTPKARCAGFYTVQSSSQQWASTWSQKP